MLDAVRLFAALTIASMSMPFGVHAAQPASNTPSNPFVDHGACPFECCTYGDWTTNTRVTLFDKPSGSKIGTIMSGSPVVGITGEVISHPISLQAVRNYAEGSIKRGDVFYALHYSGEGYWTVWHKGKTQRIQFYGDELPSSDPRASEISKDRSIWWVKVKAPDGRIGWTISDGNFDKQDACG